MELITSRPRPQAAELCEHAYVFKDDSGAYSYMPWIATVRSRLCRLSKITGNKLVRDMLTHLILHSDQSGVRSAYCAAFWREPLVREVFNKMQLLQLCRKWATAYPYETFGNHRQRAIAFGRYNRPDLAEAGADELMAAGKVDAIKILAEAARHLDVTLHSDHLELLLNSGPGLATIYSAALRVRSGATSLVLQGYALAQPAKLRPDRAMLALQVKQLFTELHRNRPTAVPCAYRWLLQGATRATGNQDYRGIEGLTALRDYLEDLGWQFLEATALPGDDADRVYVPVQTALGSTKLFHSAGFRGDKIRAKDEVLTHPADWKCLRVVDGQAYAMLHPCKPPCADGRDVQIAWANNSIEF